jgi:electron-transferring-flavoprotein dehydrogenase
MSDNSSPAPFNLDHYESMSFDVLIVGAGPSGLAAAIRLRQCALERGEDISICVLEKAPEVGRHTLSGAVLETKSLDILLPDWKDRNPPLDAPATEDLFWFLTKKYHIKLPTPPQMNNHGNFIISLGRVCAWLAGIAEGMGIDIFPGFAAVDIIPDPQNQGIKGVITGDMGRQKNGDQGTSFQPGIAILARQTLIAEGCRGSLAQKIMGQFNLRKNAQHQTYGLGIKELWEIDKNISSPGKIIHTIGWPLNQTTYGGSFLYHLNQQKMAIGFVVGLDYKNPHLSPYKEFQRFKHHPSILPMLEGGRRISYGARTISEGGFQSIPELAFPGGLLIGDAAGFLNVPKIKGVHTSMMSGIIAAETVFDALISHKDHHAPIPTLSDFQTRLKKTWLWDELYRARNIRPSFRFSLFGAVAYSALDTFILRGRAPWTLAHKTPDHKTLLHKDKSKPIKYPQPDGIVSFDRLSNLTFSGTNHEQDQPCHLKLSDDSVPVQQNLKLFDAPEQLFCPAGVYEIIDLSENNPKLQINAQNCLHCKACEIKDPHQNITWTPPQGGEGPNYESM